MCTWKRLLINAPAPLNTHATEGMGYKEKLVLIGRQELRWGAGMTIGLTLTSRAMIFRNVGAQYNFGVTIKEEAGAW